MNLLLNSRQAIVSGNGIITVRTVRDETQGTLRVTIMDNGEGIPDAVKRKIFDPFFTTKKTGEGTGLGLSVSYGIVKDHGGDISFESRQGEGSTFTVILPETTEALIYG